MIDFKELETPIRRSKPPLPEVITEEAVLGFRELIESVIKTINYPFRYGQWQIRRPRHLFTMIGGEQFANVEIPHYPARETFRGRINAQTGQKVLFEVMTRYGLDLSKTVYNTSYETTNPSTSDLVNVHSEINSYPSQEIPGLEFVRIVGYKDWPKNTRAVFVTWQAEDRAPEHAINWRRLFPPLKRLLPSTP